MRTPLGVDAQMAPITPAERVLDRLDYCMWRKTIVHVRTSTPSRLSAELRVDWSLPMTVPDLMRFGVSGPASLNLRSVSL